MTSSINPNNINGSYPVAGQDNDSQGFRDNFTNIKNNFTNAKTELEDLQSKAILKSALSGGTLSNDLNYSQLISAQLLKTVETKVDLGTQNGVLPISWADGHFQYFTTNGNVTLGFSGWPTNSQYARMRLEIKTDGSTRTITFPSAVDTGLNDIQGASGLVLTLPANGTYLFELTTYNNGTNVTIQDLLRNYDNLSANAVMSSITVSGSASISGNTLIEGSLRAIAKTYEVTVDDNGSGTQEVFFLDGTALKTNTGTELGLSFAVGETYRFDISDSSNYPANLRISTSPDTAVPSSITDHTDGVVFSGNAGNSGAYVDLTITNSTPSPLYLYAYEANVAIDTSLIGAAYPIIINGKGAVLSSNYTVPAKVSGVYTANVASANIVFSLPASPSNGQTITVVDNGNGATNKVTTVYASSKTINGSSANLIISQAYGSLTLISDGTNWATTNYQIRVSSATGKLGYNVGSTVAQATNKYTGVTLNAVTGTITMASNTMANGNVATFTLTNSVIESADYILVQHQSVGTMGAYTATATPASGSAQIHVTKLPTDAGALSEAIVLRYAVIKSANS